jgi:hypothetical protein
LNQRPDHAHLLSHVVLLLTELSPDSFHHLHEFCLLFHLIFVIREGFHWGAFLGEVLTVVDHCRSPMSQDLGGLLNGEGLLDQRFACCTLHHNVSIFLGQVEVRLLVESPQSFSLLSVTLNCQGMVVDELAVSKHAILHLILLRPYGD